MRSAICSTAPSTRHSCGSAMSGGTRIRSAKASVRIINHGQKRRRAIKNSRCHCQQWYTQFFRRATCSAVALRCAGIKELCGYRLRAGALASATFALGAMARSICRIRICAARSALPVAHPGQAVIQAPRYSFSGFWHRRSCHGGLAPLSENHWR